MKKLLALVLSLVMLCTLTIPALAAEPVTPTPPSWMAAEDYLIIPDDGVYLPENWEKVLSLRAEAENGAVTINEETKKEFTKLASAGSYYELALAWMKCAENAGVDTSKGQSAIRSAKRAFLDARSARSKVITDKNDQLHCLFGLYWVQTYLLDSSTYTSESNFGMIASVMDDVMSGLGMSLDDIFDTPHKELITPERKYIIFDRLCNYYAGKGRPVPVSPEGHIQIFLDGRYIRLDVPPAITNGRTMIPIRAVAEALGADVAWDDATKTATLSRAGHVVTLTIGNTTATIDGKAVAMDVAPYISGGRTLIPARFVAEFFGQKVEWDGETRRVFITEDKSVAGSSNLEAWAMPMGAILGLYNDGDPTQFGFGRSAENAADFRKLLGNASWGIKSREDLIATIQRMTFYGHNISFYQEASYAMSLSDEEMAELVQDSNEMGKYMWPYVKELGEKWGDRGIITWDLFRMATLAQWGYTAGYLTYEEALLLVQPSAQILSTYFSSWDEAYQNYLDGYAWWSRTNVAQWREKNPDILTENQGKEGWEDWMWMPRGISYFKLKTNSDEVALYLNPNAETAVLFDDTLFETGVIPLPAAG